MAKTKPKTHARVFAPLRGESLTEQHHKAHVDINNIMARYLKTGTLDHVRTYEGQYADLPPGDYFDAMNKITAANTMFEELPAHLRAHFKNDPRTFLHFCANTEEPGVKLQQISETYRRAQLGIDSTETPTPVDTPPTQGAAPAGQVAQPPTPAGSDDSQT